MRIAFDSQLLLDKSKTGIGWVAYNTVEQLKRNRPENSYKMNFFVLGKKKYEKYKDVLEFYSNNGFILDICNFFSYVLYKMVWPFIPIPYWLFFKRADITLFFNYYIPPGVKGKKVTMIHDMAYMACPETVNKKTLIMLKLNVKKACQRADKIITVSDFSKREIIKYLGVDSNKIEVMPNGVDKTLFNVCESKNEIKIVLDKYHITGEYFLYLGTLEPRKNIERMIDAYRVLLEECENVPKFVLAGGKGWMYDSIFEKVTKYGIEDKVIFTGYIAAVDVPLLINGAKAFLFVSLYEGFGMPVLEAMACGVPVITSNSSSLPEVIGNCGILVDPLSVEDIKNGMKAILNKEVDTAKMVKLALKRVKGFTWEKSAAIMNGVFDKI